MFRGVVCNVAPIQRPLTQVAESVATGVRCRIHKDFRPLLTHIN